MNKLVQRITGSNTSIKMERAIRLSTSLKTAHERLENDLKSQINQLDAALDNLLDFAPDSGDSLRPGVTGENPGSLMTQIQEIKVARQKLVDQLEIAANTGAELFGEAPENTQAQA